MPRFRLAIALSMLAWMAISCDQQPQSAQKEKIRVVATVFPLADVARQVGGQRVEVEWIIESGMTPEHLHLTPQIRSRVEASELVLQVGTVDLWVAGNSTSLSNARDALSLRRLYQDADHPNPPDYLWLDPQLIAAYSRELAARFSLLETDQAEYFQSNATTFALDAEKLTKDFQIVLGDDGNLRTRKFLALDNYWGAIAQRFGLQQIWLDLSGPPQRYSDEDFRTIIKTAAQEQTDVLVVAADMPPALVQYLADKTGLRLVTLDPFGMGDRLAGQRNTYTQIMRYNLQQLAEAMK